MQYEIYSETDGLKISPRPYLQKKKKLLTLQMSYFIEYGLNYIRTTGLGPDNF